VAAGLLARSRPVGISQGLKAAEQQGKALGAVVAVQQVDDQDETPAGPLAGLAFGTKDMFHVKGLPTRFGSRVFDDAQLETRDSALVALAKERGAVHIAKLAMTELAMYTPSPTTNPVNEKRTAGGSSSGSAVAIRANIADFTIGSQTGGSVIRPAAYNGVVGFKPTWNVLPTKGMLSYSPSLDTAGLFTKTVADMEHVFTALMGADSVAAELDQGPITVGVFTDSAFHRELEASSILCMDTVLAKLKTTDATIVELPFPELYSHAQAMIIAQRDAANNLRPLWQDKASASGLSPKLVAKLREWDEIPYGEYVEARRMADLAGAEMDEILAQSGADIALAPSTKGIAPMLDECLNSTYPTGDPFINVAFTLFGVPQLHLPLCTDAASEMPIGVQVLWRRHADARLLRHAQTLLANLTEP